MARHLWKFKLLFTIGLYGGSSFWLSLASTNKYEGDLTEAFKATACGMRPRVHAFPVEAHVPLVILHVLEPAWSHWEALARILLEQTWHAETETSRAQHQHSLSALHKSVLSVGRSSKRLQRKSSSQSCPAACISLELSPRYKLASVCNPHRSAPLMRSPIAP